MINIHCNFLKKSLLTIFFINDQITIYNYLQCQNNK